MCVTLAWVMLWRCTTFVHPYMYPSDIGEEGKEEAFGQHAGELQQTASSRFDLPRSDLTLHLSIYYVLSRAERSSDIRHKYMELLYRARV
jgi:hypothetical protein